MKSTTVYNRQAELGVIACAWQSKGAHARARRLLNESDFYLQSCRHLWRALESLRREGQPVDAITVVDRLDAMGVLQACGGANEVGTLLNDYPSPHGLEGYAHIVLEDSQRRRLSAAADRAVAQLNSGAELDRVVGGFAELVRTFRVPVVEQVSKRAYRYIEDALNGRGGISLEETLPWYHALAGEIQRSTYLVLGGMSGHGKSTAASIILCAAKKAEPNVRALWFSCEMPEEFQMFRLMSAMHGVPEGWFLDPRQVPVAKKEAFFSLGTKMVDLEDWCTIRRMAPLDAHGISMELEAECAEHPDAHVICVVDYIQRATAGERTERENIAKSSTVLANAALNTGATVLALSQFTEQKVREHPISLPNAGQVRGAKDIEHDAVQVLIYHRPWEDRRCVMALTKSRYPQRKPGIVHLSGDDRVASLVAQDNSCPNIGAWLPTVRVGHRRYA